jgi:hypothetical protein
MSPVNDAAIDRRAIGMDIEDRQEDSNTARFCFQNFAFIQLNDVRDSSIGRRYDEIRI